MRWFCKISNPSSSHCSSFSLMSCAVLSDCFGHENLSFSSRFSHKQNPFLSQYKILMRVRGRFIKTNSELEKTSSSMASCTNKLSPFICLSKINGHYMQINSGGLREGHHAPSNMVSVCVVSCCSCSDMPLGSVSFTSAPVIISA